MPEVAGETWIDYGSGLRVARGLRDKDACPLRAGGHRGCR